MQNKKAKKSTLHTYGNRGITLIALVITIVILLILLGVVLKVVLDKGVVDKAKASNEEQRYAIVKDEETKWTSGKLTDERGGTSSTEARDTVIDRLFEQGLITEEERDSLKEKQTIYIADKPIEFYEKASEENPEPDPDPDPDTPSGEVPDDVPIPDGFYYVGGEKDTGVVISDDINDEFKGDDHETAQELEGNQYVWIPVDNPDEMFTTNSDGSYSGKLYNFTAGKEPEVIEEFEIFGVKNYREPAFFGGIGGMDTWNGLVYNFSESGQEAEFKAMVESVKQYKGFYLGRYESEMEGDKLASKVGDPNLGEDTHWYHLYSAAKKTYPNDETNTKGAVSQMVWGCQWDAACRWFNTFPELKDDNYVTDSKTPGKGNFNSSLINTGTNENYKVKNIYDMAGNYSEQTMEAYDDEYRVRRGGSAVDVTSNAVTNRNWSFYKPNDTYASVYKFTTRLALYITEASTRYDNIDVPIPD